MVKTKCDIHDKPFYHIFGCIAENNVYLTLFVIMAVIGNECEHVAVMRILLVQFANVCVLFGKAMIPFSDRAFHRRSK